MSKKILHLDEEIPLTNEVKENFEIRDSNISITSVHNFSEAVNELSKQKFDLILLDVIIPITDADSDFKEILVDHNRTGIIFKNFVAQKILSKEISNSPKICLYTARTNLSAQDVEGVDKVIYKPKGPLDVFKKIKSIL